MKPRLLLPLGALLALVLVGPAVVAQDATPAPEAATAGLARTDTRYFLPYGRDGLNATLTVTTTEDAVCGAPSLADPGRPDA